MANQNGIAIIIKAWLPTGKTLDEQLSALTIVKAARESSDYAPLLAAAKIEAVSTESKTRRMAEEAAPATPGDQVGDVYQALGAVDGLPKAERLAAPDAVSALAEAISEPVPTPAPTTVEYPFDTKPSDEPEPVDPAPTDVPDMSKVRTAADGRAAKKKVA